MKCHECSVIRLCACTSEFWKDGCFKTEVALYDRTMNLDITAVIEGLKVTRCVLLIPCTENS